MCSLFAELVIICSLVNNIKEGYDPSCVVGLFDFAQQVSPCFHLYKPLRLPMLLSSAKQQGCLRKFICLLSLKELYAKNNFRHRISYHFTLKYSTGFPSHLTNVWISLFCNDQYDLVSGSFSDLISYPLSLNPLQLPPHWSLSLLLDTPTKLSPQHLYTCCSFSLENLCSYILIYSGLGLNIRGQLGKVEASSILPYSAFFHSTLQSFLLHVQLFINCSSYCKIRSLRAWTLFCSILYLQIGLDMQQAFTYA